MSNEKNTPTEAPIVHVGTIRPKGPKKEYLLLRKTQNQHFEWFAEGPNGQEVSCDLAAPTIQEAIRLAWRKWETQHFLPLNCGFRFTLPERDEIGRNAYFYEMVASFGTATGPYLDDKVDHMCTVTQPSREALDVMKRLQAAGRL